MYELGDILRLIDDRETTVKFLRYDGDEHISVIPLTCSNSSPFIPLKGCTYHNVPLRYWEKDPLVDSPLYKAIMGIK
jgi:hypothetical protein